jgi:hypothetical protein
MRYRLFAWLVVQGRFLTADALAKRGWPHNESSVLCALFEQPQICQLP